MPDSTMPADGADNSSGFPWPLPAAGAMSEAIEILVPSPAREAGAALLKRVRSGELNDEVANEARELARYASALADTWEQSLAPLAPADRAAEIRMSDDLGSLAHLLTGVDAISDAVAELGADPDSIWSPELSPEQSIAMLTAEVVETRLRLLVPVAVSARGREIAGLLRAGDHRVEVLRAAANLCQLAEAVAERWDAALKALVDPRKARDILDTWPLAEALTGWGEVEGLLYEVGIDAELIVDHYRTADGAAPVEQGPPWPIEGIGIGEVTDEVRSFADRLVERIKEGERTAGLAQDVRTLGQYARSLSEAWRARVGPLATTADRYYTLQIADGLSCLAELVIGLGAIYKTIDEAGIELESVVSEHPEYVGMHAWHGSEEPSLLDGLTGDELDQKMRELNPHYDEAWDTHDAKHGKHPFAVEGAPAAG